ncbi:hypothetical protein WJX72_006792 [[Myrmecia] bisecta]|uniref:Phosphoglycerate mutase n=1 Tax=[Myrmecia] bisecta TaxID=41462 RepID=A0AAW1Q2E9_9CHLO
MHTSHLPSSFFCHLQQRHLTNQIRLNLPGTCRLLNQRVHLSASNHRLAAVAAQARSATAEPAVQEAPSRPETTGRTPQWEITTPLPQYGPENTVSTARQYMIVMRHGERIDEIDKSWSLNAARPWDPHLTDKGEQQARAVAENLRQYEIKKVFMSPFYRCIQTAMMCAEELGIPPEHWTVSCGVCELLYPRIMVKNGARLPEGHINDWFWERGSMQDSLPPKLPKEVMAKIKLGQQTFGRFPENLINSRPRFERGFQEAADATEGNVLVVTHGDGVASSITRMIPWAVAYPVLHTGYTVAFRDRSPEGAWGKWHLQSKTGENGVWFNGHLQPAFMAWSGARAVYRVLTPWVHRPAAHTTPAGEK